MQACSFHNSDGTTIANTEPVPRLAVHEECSSRGSVQRTVADDGTFPRVSRRTGMRADDDTPSRHRFADRIVCLAVQDHVDAVNEEDAETLTGASGKFEVDLIFNCPGLRDTPVGPSPVLPAGEFA